MYRRREKNYLKSINVSDSSSILENVWINWQLIKNSNKIAECIVLIKCQKYTLKKANKIDCLYRNNYTLWKTNQKICNRKRQTKKKESNIKKISFVHRQNFFFIIGTKNPFIIDQIGKLLCVPVKLRKCGVCIFCIFQQFT